MKISKPKIKNIIFLLVIGVLLIPQTRKPVQVVLHKVIAFIKPVSVNEDKDTLTRITDYKWSLIDENHTIFNFEAAKGKVVLINFWATWCPPCIAEMPSMQALYDDYKDKIVFLFVTNDAFNEIIPFLTKNNYTFKVHRPVEEYPEFFNISTIPRTFLIDKEGHIIIDENGAANWNSDKIRTTIDTLLK
ncbi:TlpA disulfide reductase family protein [Mariniflexile litorale]|uniref:TlpA disulfide reductase family protein n=1 Tax=Mariniflexile litorale TaxID=3045158 RepID=A0AAU7EHD9_9FLAO|nr:TlpA disulfide reductase family protein [Mariniflexile sp. KMM 9835]MDQ8210810.1 TlpA disulfide reductase family protein [Mariniflexile sp. KMM 9835]